MFVGREQELTGLNGLYRRGGFQMVVLYGRRRVGKTALAEEFMRDKPSISFTAMERSAQENLRAFSAAIMRYAGFESSDTAFGSWREALTFLARHVAEAQLVLLIDEFPYAAQSQPSLPSELQVTIDETLKDTNIFLILCGSNQGFMETEVLGYKSPLFGRRTGQIHLQPFDYLGAAKMLPGCTPEDAAMYYACIGGVPYYLAAVDLSLSFAQNIEQLFFQKIGLLYEEPEMLLRQELREPALYNSIIAAIAGGAVRLSEITDRVGVERSLVAKYLATLVELGVIDRETPFGENPRTTKRGHYYVRDGCFAFWYRFVGSNTMSIESGTGSLAARAALDSQSFSTFMGKRFELMCREWMARQAAYGVLPVQVTAVGAWWGTDPVARAQTDIDVVAADSTTGRAIFGECKWRNRFNESEAIEGLKAKCDLVKGCKPTWFYLFSKHPVSDVTAQKHKDEAVRFVCLDEMFDAA